MTSKSWSRKSIATVVAVAVLSVYSMVVLAAPGAKASGELSVSGQVTVNGQKMVSGGTVFTDSTISTAPQSSASVSIPKVGRVDLSANSNLRISFSNSSITAMLETGSAQVSTLAGTTVNLTTKDGTVVVDGKEATSFSVSASRGRTFVVDASNFIAPKGDSMQHKSAALKIKSVDDQTGTFTGLASVFEISTHTATSSGEARSASRCSLGSRYR